VDSIDTPQGFLDPPSQVLSPGQVECSHLNVSSAAARPDTAVIPPRSSRDVQRLLKTAGQRLRESHPEAR
jgi:hypothetical protein